MGVGGGCSNHVDQPSCKTIKPSFEAEARPDLSVAAWQSVTSPAASSRRIGR